MDLSELINFYSTWKHQRTYSFLVISGGIDNQFAQIGLIRQVKFSDSEFISQHHKISGTLHKKMKFSIKDFFSKRDQIRSFQRIWSDLL